MSIQVINTGTSANAGNGDSIRTAFTKVNENFSFLSGLISGTGTDFNSDVRDIVKPMFLHDLHQRVEVTYNVINDQIVLSVDPFTSTDLTLRSLEVIGTSTFKDVTITGTVTVGFLQGVDDIDINKYAEDGSLNFSLKNTYGIGDAEINLRDYYDGAFNIVHQNSGANNGPYRAGQNYIFDDSGRAINIGRASNINFYADQSWTSYGVPQVSINNTGTVVVNTELQLSGDSFVVGGNQVTVSSSTIQINGTEIAPSLNRLVADSFTLSLTTAGNVILPNGSSIDYNSTDLVFSVNSSTLRYSTLGELYLDQNGAYDGVDLSGTTFRIDVDQPNYTQIYVKNHNTGTTATSDLMIFNNTTTVDSGYIDLGINSTSYTEAPYGLHTEGSGYLFTKDVDLVVGTQGLGTKLIFHAGGDTVNDSAGEVNAFTWQFNRSVQTIVGTPGPLNFTVWNTQNNSAAQAVYQAMNDAGQLVHFGINSSNSGAAYGRVGPSESFLHNHNTTATLHIGSGGDLAFYSDEANGFSGTPTLVMSRVDKSSTFAGHVLPDSDLAYDLGSTSSQWRSLYVGTSTVYFGGIPLTVSAGGTLTVDGNPVSGGATTGDITFSATTVSAPNESNILIQAKDVNGIATARLELSPEYGIARLESSSERIENFYEGSGFWITATWTVSEFGRGTLTFTGAELLYDFLNNNSDWNFGQNPKFGWNGGELIAWGGYSYGGGTLTIDLDTLVPPIDPTAVTEIELRWDSVSKIEVDANDDSEILIAGRGIPVNITSSVDVNITAGDDFRLESNDILRFINNSSTDPVEIITDGNNTNRNWSFNPNGTVTFPDGSTQQTAWAGGRVVDAPLSSKGASGDQLGDLAFTDDHIYRCTANYTDGIADIWKRIQWSADTW